jgi:hypothetical protein
MLFKRGIFFGKQSHTVFFVKGLALGKVYLLGATGEVESMSSSVEPLTKRLPFSLH